MLLVEMLNRSRTLAREDHKKKEVEKLGNLRVGNSGILSESGEVAGSCIRKAHLRQLGIDIEPTTPPDKQLMFDMGLASEDIIAAQIRKAVDTTTHVVLQEEEIPVSWITSNGTNVSGRPDIVICRVVPDGKPVPETGIELKTVNSMWVARDVLFRRKPKLANLIQSAHYMWKLGLPTYKLVYTSYSQLGQGMAGAEAKWILDQFPRKGEPMSEHIEFSNRRAEKGGRYLIKHLKQFQAVYDLRTDPSGRLYYKLESEGESSWSSTIVTIDYIERYFEYASRLAGSGKGQLGARPSGVDALGGKAGYLDCDYCPLQNVCDRFEASGYNGWLSAVRDHVADNSTKVIEK